MLPETRKLRYVQLQLGRPVAKLKAYSLRQVQVVGPRLAEARPWSSRNQKDGDSAAEGGVLTRLSRAVSFLHKDYRPELFWWEMAREAQPARPAVPPGTSQTSCQKPC